MNDNRLITSRPRRSGSYARYANYAGYTMYETGAPMKVQQELTRHADIRTTMNVYGKAMDESKRVAHGKVVRLVLPSQVA